MTQASDREMIGELMQNWGFWRDQGEWDALRTTFHPEGRIRVTWFSGLFTEFVTTSMEMRKRRSGVKHWIGGSKIDINGNRAIAETNVMIMGRPVLHDVLVDSVAYSRFYDFVEVDEASGRIAAEPEYGAKMRNIRLDPVSSATPEAFRGWLVAQKQVWADVVRKGRTVSRYHSLLHDFAKRGRVHG